MPRLFFSYLHMISTDYPLEAYLPRRFHALLLSILQDVFDGHYETICRAKKFCLEVYSLLQAAIEAGEGGIAIVCNFLQALMNQIEAVHKGKPNNNAVPTSVCNNATIMCHWQCPKNAQA